MSVVGRVESVWRYPVKSMRGEELPEIFAGFAGVYGDRLFAFKSTATPAGLSSSVTPGLPSFANFLWSRNGSRRPIS